jgi:hypothetical protein
MRRWIIAVLAVAVLAGGVIAWRYGPWSVGGPSVDGTWKVVFFPPDGTEVALWLIEIDSQGKQHSAKVLAGSRAELKNTKVYDVRVDDSALQMKMEVEGGQDIPITVFLPAGESDPSILRGTLVLRGQPHFAHLERADAKDWGNSKAVNAEAAQELALAGRSTDPSERQRAYRGIIAEHAGKPAAFMAGLGLLRSLVQGRNSSDELRQEADRVIEIAAAYGPQMKTVALTEVARQLKDSEKSANLAVEYARQADQELPEGAPPGNRLPLLKALAAALGKSGQAAEAGIVQARIEQIEAQLDAEYLKSAIPFQPTPFAGRKGSAKRVALVELFTGAQCPPCVAADVAFDALLQTYQPTDVVLLQYHVHVPGPDPLTNPDSEARSRYYDIEGTPTVYLNGQTGPFVGGGKKEAEPGYKEWRKKIEQILETDTPVNLQLTANRTKDSIQITAKVNGLAMPSAKFRLRFALVEEMVRYAGSNGQRLHHHVVRAFPGGVEGKSLDAKTNQYTVTVQVPDLIQSLQKYLTAYGARRPFPGEDRPLELKELKVVAFLQDDETKMVLLAAQAELEPPK